MRFNQYLLAKYFFLNKTSQRSINESVRTLCLNLMININSKGLVFSCLIKGFGSLNDFDNKCILYEDDIKIW